MGLRRLGHYITTNSTLRIVGFGGLVGVFMDVDHIVAHYLWPTTDPDLVGRFLHPAYLIIGLFLSGVVVACIMGLLLGNSNLGSLDCEVLDEKHRQNPT
jgi:hypothetical protein